MYLKKKPFFRLLNEGGIAPFPLLTAMLIACLLLIPLFQINGVAQQAAATASKGKVFLAGASKTNITPPLGGILVGGFGDPVAGHIHDDLHSRHLVLDDGETRLVLVVVDNLGINREVFHEAKRRLEDEPGIPA